MCADLLRRAGTGAALLAVAAAGLGCSPPRNLAPHPARSITDLALRNRAIDDVCSQEFDDWPAVFGDVRLDAYDETTWLDTSRSAGVLAERLSRSGGGSRFRDRDQTLLEQLEGLSLESMTDVWTRARARFVEQGTSWLADAASLKIDAGANAVTGFLVNHVVALRFAAMASDTSATDDAWACALAHEAAALGYLVDAMSADRMLDARSPGPFPGLSFNRHDAERYFGANGVFVIDHRGHVWQAHGRDQLEWYPTHLCRVMAASQEAVRELFLVTVVSRSMPLPGYLARWVDADPLGRDAATIVSDWLTDRSGAAWLVEQRLGSLASLPMPIWATWRRKVGEPDDDGVRPAVHRPQLRDEGLHDPSIGAPPSSEDEVPSREFVGLDQLHEAAAFPDWYGPADWLEEGPAWAIAQDRDMASNRFVHLVSYPPSFSGLYLAGSLGAGVVSDDVEVAHAIGVGYLRHLALAWLGVQAEFSPEFLAEGREVGAATAVVGLLGPVHRPSVWIELGVARAHTSASTRYGFRGRLAYIPFTIGPGPRYSGFSPRLEIGVTDLDQPRWRAGVGIVIH